MILFSEKCQELLEQVIDGLEEWIIVDMESVACCQSEQDNFEREDNGYFVTLESDCNESWLELVKRELDVVHDDLNVLVMCYEYAQKHNNMITDQQYLQLCHFCYTTRCLLDKQLYMEHYLLEEILFEIRYYY